MNAPHPDNRNLGRFAPKASETSKIKVTRFTDLCKSCGICIAKCPVNAISWHKKEVGMLGEPAVYIDLDKCIGCETCERVCPDHAIEITNKRLESERFSKGILGTIVRSNARVIEFVMSRVRVSSERLKQFGKSEEKTLSARILRALLFYREEPIKEYDIEES